MNDKFKQMQLIMGVYTIADKYDIERLIPPVKAKFKEILDKTQNHEVLSSVIRTHYSAFAEPGHNIGNLIATSLLGTHDRFTATTPFKSMCIEIPTLAIDIITNMGRLRCLCCRNTNFVGRAREEGQIFKCSYCSNPNLGKLPKDFFD
jgi:hypothetical protein